MSSISKDLIEELLNEEESTTLDFKSEQYPFIGENNETKSEIIKDILAFANAWKRTTAYILIGIKEVKGGRSEVCGVSRHLNDNDLQQLINKKTQRPITFSYHAFEFENNQIGIIEIPVQERPIYLKADFGKLEKETVYIRWGSSTDIAKPDDVAKKWSGLFGQAKPIYKW